MTKYRVSWRGVVHRTFDVERPSDVLYLLWTRHGADIAPGLIAIDAAGAATFPVSVGFEIQADDMHEAAQALRDEHPLYDMGGDVTVEEVRP